MLKMLTFEIVKGCFGFLGLLSAEVVEYHGHIVAAPNVDAGGD